MASRVNAPSISAIVWLWPDRASAKWIAPLTTCALATETLGSACPAATLSPWLSEPSAPTDMFTTGWSMVSRVTL